jgi:hypothetical protein
MSAAIAVVQALEAEREETEDDGVRSLQEWHQRA